MEILETEKVLNTVEVCRLIHGRDKRDVDYCYKGQGFREKRTWKTMCRRLEHDCEFNHRQIWGTLRTLQERHYIESVVMEFHDSWGNQTDIFRFWFINFDDFEKRILRQTLIPYIQGHAGSLDPHALEAKNFFEQNQDSPPNNSSLGQGASGAEKPHRQNEGEKEGLIRSE